MENDIIWFTTQIGGQLGIHKDNIAAITRSEWRPHLINVVIASTCKRETFDLRHGDNKEVLERAPQ